MALPDLALPATFGGSVDLARLSGRTVLYIYPRTGVHGVELPPGWSEISGPRGFTPQSCGFRVYFAALMQLGVAPVFGLSMQDTAYQQEAAHTLLLPFAILSDEALAFATALRLPTFSTAGITLLKRMAHVINAGIITKVFYPVFLPDRNAADVVAWIQAFKQARTSANTFRNISGVSTPVLVL